MRGRCLRDEGEAPCMGPSAQTCGSTHTLTCTVHLCVGPDLFSYCSVIKYYDVRKGPEFSVQLCKLETDLTPEMVQRCVPPLFVESL